MDEIKNIRRAFQDEIDYRRDAVGHVEASTTDNPLVVITLKSALARKINLLSQFEAVAAQNAVLGAKLSFLSRKMESMVDDFEMISKLFADDVKTVNPAYVTPTATHYKKMSDVYKFAAEKIRKELDKIQTES